MSANNNQNEKSKGNVGDLDNTAEIQNESITKLSSKKPNSTKIFMGFIGAIIVALILWYVSSLLYNWYMAEFPSKPTTEAKIVDATNITSNNYVTVTWDELEDNRKTQKVAINLKQNFSNVVITTNLDEDHVTISNESDSVYNVEFDVPPDPNTILQVKIESDQFKQIVSTKQITD